MYFYDSQTPPHSKPKQIDCEGKTRGKWLPDRFERGWLAKQTRELHPAHARPRKAKRLLLYPKTQAARLFRTQRLPDRPNAASHACLAEPMWEAPNVGTRRREGGLGHGPEREPDEGSDALFPALAIRVRSSRLRETKSTTMGMRLPATRCAHSECGAPISDADAGQLECGPLAGEYPVTRVSRSIHPSPSAHPSCRFGSPPLPSPSNTNRTRRTVHPDAMQQTDAAKRPGIPTEFPSNRGYAPPRAMATCPTQAQSRMAATIGAWLLAWRTEPDERNEEGAYRRRPQRDDPRKIEPSGKMDGPPPLSSATSGDWP